MQVLPFSISQDFGCNFLRLDYSAIVEAENSNYVKTLSSLVADSLLEKGKLFIPVHRPSSRMLQLIGQARLHMIQSLCIQQDYWSVWKKDLEDKNLPCTHLKWAWSPAKFLLKASGRLSLPRRLKLWSFISDITNSSVQSLLKRWKTILIFITYLINGRYVHVLIDQSYAPKIKAIGYNLIVSPLSWSTVEPNPT